MAIDHNKEVVHINTPYDAIIIKLNSKLNSTYISYGSLGSTKMAMQYSQDTNAMELEQEVAVKRAVSKSSRLYNNKNWDLVDAAADDTFDVNKLKKHELPKELQNKSTLEITNYIELKKEEREKIQKEIQQLNSMRKTYIENNKKGSSKGELESVMLSAIKKQAKEKNYSWE